MTKEDAEQHSKVWELAAKLIDVELQKSYEEKIELLTAANLAVSNLARAVSQSYETMARAIHAKP